MSNMYISLVYSRNVTLCHRVCVFPVSHINSSGNNQPKLISSFRNGREEVDFYLSDPKIYGISLQTACSAGLSHFMSCL